MKRLLTLVLMFLLLGCTAIAESVPSREFTVDEQAYDVYLDISTVYKEGVHYLEELGFLWDCALKMKSSSDAHDLWFSTTYLASDFARYAALSRYATDKCDYSDPKELYPLFSSLLSSKGDNATSIVWAGLELEHNAKYVKYAEDLQPTLNEAMDGIRSIMALNRDYPFLTDLKNYFKEASYLLDYIDDFEDNYSGFQNVLATQKKNQSSFEIDFEFVFNPADFAYVTEVRYAEQQAKYKIMYEHAAAFENNQQYDDAIESYWQCIHYADSSDRIKICRSAKSQNADESAYQEAQLKESAGDFAAAISLYSSLNKYKDSASRLESCKKNAYSQALELKKLQDYASALLIYDALGDYEDSMHHKQLCQDALSKCVSVDAVYNGLARVKRNGKYGYVDTNGIPVIPCIYNQSGNFIEELAPVQLQSNGKWGYINQAGKLVVPYQYDHASEFKEGFGAVSINKKHGFINGQGTVILPIEYDFAGDIACGVAFFRGNGQRGIVDPNGRIVSLNEYDMQRLTFSEGLAPVSKNKKYGYVNTSGELVIPCKYTSAANFTNGFARVLSGTKWGLVDANGSELVPCKYDWVNHFSENMASVSKNGKYGYINASQKQVIPFKYDSADDFNGGIAKVQLNKKYGFINTKNETIIPFDYDNALKFFEGACAVQKNGYWGTIDKQNNTIIPFKYKEPLYYDDGLYMIDEKSGEGCLSVTGEIIIPYEYDEVHYSDGWFTLLKDGVITILSRESVQPGYKDAQTVQITKVQTDTDTAESVSQTKNYNTLKPGSKGQAVLNARMKLYELGYFSKKPTQTEYTNNMKDYVKRFEKDNGLKQDGILSPEDQVVLFSL